MEVELLYTAEHEGRGLLHTVEHVGLLYTVEHSDRVVVLYSLEQGGGVIIHR